MFLLDPRGGHNRYTLNIDFFKKWTEKMAYVLGFLYADGDIEDVRESSRAQCIAFTSVDKEILEEIKKAMGSGHNLNYRAPRKTIYQNGKTYENSGIYRLRIGSKEMFNDLLKLGLTPRKSLAIKFPMDVPDKYLHHFIRGYFDGDGCATVKWGVGKYGQRILKGLAVIFISGSEEFLEGLSKTVYRVVGFDKKEICDSIRYSRAYQLKYSTVQESLKWFNFLYANKTLNLFLKRKFDVFEKYFQLRPIRVDEGITNILREYGRVSK
jgi:hypothetical protein